MRGEEGEAFAAVLMVEDMSDVSRFAVAPRKVKRPLLRIMVFWAGHRRPDSHLEIPLVSLQGL